MDGLFMGEEWQLMGVRAVRKPGAPRTRVLSEPILCITRSVRITQ